jgi:VWFA-related protein
MKRWLLLLLLFILALGWVGLMSADFQGDQGTPAADGSSAEIAYFDYDQSDFGEVTIYLTVRDGQGDSILGLDEEDFTITEDGVAVRVTEFIPGGAQPVTAVMLIDHSGSMEDGSKMADAKDAALTFLDQLQTGRDRVGVIAFDDETDMLGSLQSMSNSVRSRLERQIEQLYADGGTAYYDAIYQAADMLDGVSGRKVVLALTDGIDEHSVRDRSAVLDYAKDNNIVLYTIGLGANVRGYILEDMAEETDGEYYEEPSSGQLAELYAELAQSLQEEYSLTYTSPTPRLDGTTRDVEVTAQLSSGTVSAVGEYAVGGTLTPTPNVWPCLGALPLLLMLVLPGLYDKLRGRGQLADAEPIPPAAVTPPPSPAPSARSRSGTSVMDEPQPWVPPTPSASPEGDTCLSCGKELRPGAQFCPACGQPVFAEPQATPECAHCGTSLRPSAKFCPTCGQSTSSDPNQPTCSHCGATLKVGAAFCAKCGRRV